MTATLLISGVPRLLFCAAFVAVLAPQLAGCAGPTTSMKLPSCSENIEVKGQHLRRGDTTLTFDHAFDLPGSSTQVTLERADGTTNQRDYLNAYPDILHVVGGGLALLAGGTLLAVYLNEVGRGAEPLGTELVWAAPVGTGLLGVSGALLLTGWHPIDPIILPQECGSNQ